MVVSDEKEDQRKRLKYILANGVSDGLVARPTDWPGPNVARALVHDEPLTGYRSSAHSWECHEERRRGASKSSVVVRTGR
jgi:hypothetical protein